MQFWNKTCCNKHISLKCSKYILCCTKYRIFLKNISWNMNVVFEYSNRRNLRLYIKYLRLYIECCQLSYQYFYAIGHIPNFRYCVRTEIGKSIYIGCQYRNDSNINNKCWLNFLFYGLRETKFQFVWVVEYAPESEYAWREPQSRAKWIRVMALRFKLMPRLMTLIGFHGHEKGENAKGKIL